MSGRGHDGTTPATQESKVAAVGPTNQPWWLRSRKASAGRLCVHRLSRTSRFASRCALTIAPAVRASPR